MQSSDASHGFYDRSLGAQQHGTAAQGPYQLTSASNRSTGSARQGDLATSFDDAGNLTALVVKRDGPCLPAGASCWQRFAYEWDEVGRLSGARRWDLAGAERTANAALSEPLPARHADVELRYAYDANDDRVLKTAVDPLGHELHTAYIFDSLELRRAAFADGDYELTADAETVYLWANGVRLARLLFADEDAPSATSGRQHVLLELGDHLGSSANVIDRDTGELVERTTYTAYGGAESDYRPARWGSHREAYRFTGKEDDSEVGLTYFGKRYYAPGLGRWVSADPLAIHEARADLNVYAYVHGRTYIARDPNGTFTIAAIAVAMAISFAVGMAVSATAQASQNNWNWRKVDWGNAAIAGGAAAVGTGLTMASFGAAAPAASAKVGADMASKFVAALPAAYGSGALGAMGATASYNLAMSGGQTAGKPEDLAKAGMVGGVTMVATVGVGAALGVNPLPAKTPEPAPEPAGATPPAARTWDVPRGPTGAAPEAPVPAPGRESSTVDVYHGSIKDGPAIRASGLDPNRLPVSVSRDRMAAEDALRNHYDAVPGRGEVIRSRIPREIFDEHFRPNEQVYRGFYPYELHSTEIPLRTPMHVEIFNMFMVRF